MRTRSLFILVVLSTAVLVTAAHARRDAGDAETRAAAPGEDARPKSAKPVLEKGMAAETIVQLVGKPAEINPMDSRDGKAEKWIYRRVVETKHVLDSVTQETIPVFLRANPSEGNVMGTATRPLFNLKHVTTYQVTALLLFDGKLVVAKQWQEQSQSYDH